MNTPPCPCCGVVIPTAAIVPDGTYPFGEFTLISFKCVPPCKTNRAIRWTDAPREIKEKAAALEEK